MCMCNGAVLMQMEFLGTWLVITWYIVLHHLNSACSCSEYWYDLWSSRKGHEFIASIGRSDNLNLNLIRYWADMLAAIGDGTQGPCGTRRVMFPCGYHASFVSHFPLIVISNWLCKACSLQLFKWHVLLTFSLLLICTEWFHTFAPGMPEWPQRCSISTVGGWCRSSGSNQGWLLAVFSNYRLWHFWRGSVSLKHV